MCNALKDHVAKVEENLQRGKYYDFIHIPRLIYGVQPTLPTTLLITSMHWRANLHSKSCHVGMEEIPR